jgi:hypothetical protein
MNHTLTAPVAVEHATARAAASRPGLLGGLGGLVFAGAVLVQNAIRSGFPTADANAEEVMRYYADHRGATVALAVLFPVGLVALTTFLGTVISRVVRGAGRTAALVGAFGAAAIIGTFTIVTSADVAIAAYVDRGAADVAVVDGLWVLHNAVFGFLLAAVGIALGGLSTAAARSGLLSKRWSVAGPVGAALLITGAATTPAIVDGSATFVVGVAGFAVWLAFVIRTAVALLRSPEA